MILAVKRCPYCHCYNSIDQKICVCGENIERVTAEETDSHIPCEEYGRIDPKTPYYVAVCPKCGKRNLTADQNIPVQVCSFCRSAEIAGVRPVSPSEPTDTDKKTDGQEDHGTVEKGEPGKYYQYCRSCRKWFPLNSPEDRYTQCPYDGRLHIADFEPIPYEEYLKRTAKRPAAESENGNRAEEKAEEHTAAAVKDKSEPKPAEEPLPDIPNRDKLEKIIEAISKLRGLQAHRAEETHTDARTPAQEDGGDGEGEDWSGFGIDADQSDPPSRLTLVCVGNADVSLTWDSRSCPEEILIGRHHCFGDALSSDMRVSRKHCTIRRSNGKWTVENNSGEGTFLNLKNIGEHGERDLHNGDVLRLGHLSDTPQFRVVIT